MIYLADGAPLDSPVEGFAFRLWQWDEEEAADTFTAGGRNRQTEEEIERCANHNWNTVFIG